MRSIALDLREESGLLGLREVAGGLRPVSLRLREWAGAWSPVSEEEGWGMGSWA